MILVSACLAGFRCRYDAKIAIDETVAEWVRRGEAIPVCPELLGGLPCPRVPCERRADGRVVASDGTDRTDAFTLGAEETLRIARLYGCERAVLKARSPSCGGNGIYDGTFTGTLTDGEGVTAALLRQNGIAVEVRE
ncbi:MAG: DUF523 domain-containing protein [Clostridia bacterium]|nr:DUF523 domain-containing protein [Clostridia bacterium]